MGIPALSSSLAGWALRSISTGNVFFFTSLGMIAIVLVARLAGGMVHVGEKTEMAAE
jgi:hypothetical protein